VNTLSVDSRFPGVGGTRTSSGNIGAFFKYILIQNNKGSLLSTGLLVNIPTGPASFAGYHTTRSINTTEIQPYLGYILTGGGNWYAQGFSSVSVPTNSALPTLLYIDNALGYYVYRSNDLRRLVTAVAPTFETHLNIPLNHRGYTSDPFGVPTVLDLTFGLNLEIFGNSVLTFAYVRPVTGPLPFDGEFALLFNARFGASRRTRALPPVAGG
ncbi:MAG: hypothetical protein LC745_06220, partial [Planctomycetia bacterium]|nr:hypothetical protein [Planctomycetia bacterium]